MELEQDPAEEFWNNRDLIDIRHVLENENMNIFQIIYLLHNGVHKMQSIIYTKVNPQPDYFELISPYINVRVLSIRSDSISEQNVRQIAHNCNKLLELTLQVLPNVSCNSIEKIFKRNTELLTFILHGHHCQWDYIHDIYAPCLRGLPKNIKDLQFISCKMSPRSLLESLYGLSHLAYFRLDNCFGIPCDFVKRVIDAFPNILNFEHNFVQYGPKYKPMLIIPHINCIKQFVSFYNPFLNDQLLKYICDTCFALEIMQIGNPLECDDLYTEPNSEHSDRSLNFTASGISYLASVKFLTTLEIYGITSNNLLRNMTPLANKGNLQFLTLITRGEDFSEVAAKFIVESFTVQTITILGQIANIRNAINTRAIFGGDRRNKLKLCLEEESLESWEVTAYNNLNFKITFSRSETYCRQYIRTHYFGF